MYKAIIFDLDDTLIWDAKSIQMAFQDTCKKAAAINPAIDSNKLVESVKVQARKLYESYETYPFTQQIGINPFEGLWGKFEDKGEDFKKLHHIVPDYQIEAWTEGLKGIGIVDAELGQQLADTFPQMRKKHVYYYPDTFSVLDSLYGTYKLLLLTNGSPDLQQTKLNLSPELARYFDHIVISGSYGRGKPDKGIFDYALSLLDVQEGEAIMIGDNLLTDIRGANLAGIDSVWINHHQRVASDDQPDYEVKGLGEVLSIINQNSK
ncbi:HAD family hydrolase [Ornithinibacillus gellani]|uniref:HAD family hydrolase n=1 Tax=Ornithinibacillus gellani TaxID=2293253 RepID=UPI000F48D658|nr:HAD family hydrolase [Ornithinibacillus gellani]TQS76539.1 HAD family hydrolase [Ornithinibacillus gellani]